MESPTGLNSFKKHKILPPLVRAATIDSMDHNGDSISEWLGRLREGEAAAAQNLWDRYSAKLIRLAKQRLGTSPPGISNEDDLALSVFASVFRGAAEGRFEKVTSRDELWWLLLAITKQKAVDYRRRESALKRGAHHASINYSLDELVASTPSPDFAAALEDEYARLLEGLPNDMLRKIATLRMEGYTAAEIAQQTSIAVRAVERKLQMVRNKWKAEFNQAPDS
jgi:DNA-directed RNA polymerase specialized sigma24 family protein